MLFRWFRIFDLGGWMDLSCQGNDKLRTPKIDEFAAKGVRFTDAYSASPVCSPTRAGLMTGLAPARLNITQHGTDTPVFWPEGRTIQPPEVEHIQPLDRITLAERLRDAGYATGFFGKWHLSGSDVKEDDPTTGGAAFYPDKQGFDVNLAGCGMGGPPTYFDPYRIPTLKPRKEGEYLSERLADETIAWMGKHHGPLMFVRLWTCPHWCFHKQNRPGSANRDGKYKLIFRYDDQSVELYDLKADPGETRNLARDFPDVTERLKTQLETWLEETCARRPTRVE